MLATVVVNDMTRFDTLLFFMCGLIGLVHILLIVSCVVAMYNMWFTRDGHKWTTPGALVGIVLLLAATVGIGFNLADLAENTVGYYKELQAK